ncbi:hypothetical protein L3Q65_00285 (plasmid) [Amycolatopsis sp. FU40]|uniref:hypothetical protein n=1 Tax=Amycolatopsis sp. FU40 TaxID=2914159 RepID=UPI001F196B31|nr:hypothetical protein [Amycolatopsis sp. FU40]UKD50737.1 hypothetical protein L3Q65_00285 [Amycolatopsis sp. FU40]
MNRQESAGREALVVDPEAHAREIARFLRRVVRRPATDAADPAAMTCAIWTGAIGDDGYGRFSVTRDGRERTVKPHRYAVALALGLAVEAGQVIEHVVCDNPVCVHADPDPMVGHIWPSTQSENLARMQAKGRGQRWWLRRWSGLARAERAERSRQLAAAVRDGWDDDAVRAVLLRIDPAQATLF